MAWFDLYELFVQHISGSMFVFTILAILGITYFAIYINLNNRTTTAIILVFLLMMAAFSQNLLIIAVFIIGLIVTWSIHRLLGGRQ